MYDPLRAKLKVALYGGLTFFLGLGIAAGLGWTHASLAMPVIDQTPKLSAEAIKPATDLSEAFVNIADVVTPAVVRIESRRPARMASSRGAPQEFFDLFGGGGRNRDPQPEFAGGTGFIASADGYILTNNHVVAESDRVTVFLHDRREFEARVIGGDPFTDVAVIKIDAAGELPHLSFGDSEGVKVGQWVLAVGNPGFGGTNQLDYTVTAGIVSARGRSNLRILQNDLRRQYGNAADPETQRLPGYALEDFIQTDAVINPGNSGGPMVNLQGQVVGINSAIATNTGYYQGYGFAIPINIAHRVMEDLVEYGHVKRPMVGVQMGTVSSEDAEQYGLPRVAGALVQPEFPANSPAQKAGVRAGDVIVAVDGRPIDDSSELQQRIAGYKPGDRVKLTVYRNRKPMDIQVQLGEAPINNLSARPVERSTAADERLGIRVAEISDADAREQGFEAGGVVITDVQAGSAASRKLAEGMRIVEIDGRDINRPDDVRAALEGVRPGAVVSVEVEIPGAGHQIANVRMPAR
jgi:serine protease Do